MAPPYPPFHRSYHRSFSSMITRRSFSCYNCNHSFHITPTPSTIPSPPTSFRCPSCHHRHFIPFHTVAPPAPPPVAAPVPPPPPFIRYENWSLPMPRTYVNSLPVQTTFAPNAECSICMEGFVITRTVNVLPCEHCFHRDCIGKWLERRNTCPMCRYKLPCVNMYVKEEEEEEEEDDFDAYVADFIAQIRMPMRIWEFNEIERLASRNVGDHGGEGGSGSGSGGGMEG